MRPAWSSVHAVTLIGALLTACSPGEVTEVVSLGEVVVEAVDLDHETRWAIRDVGANGCAIRMALTGRHLVLAFGRESAPPVPVRIKARFSGEGVDDWPIVEGTLPPPGPGEAEKGWVEWRIQVPERLRGTEGVLALGGDGPGTRIALPTLVPERNPDSPNIILVSLDTLRSDRLGCYGNPRPTSPTMDRLAAEGVLFRSALAPSSWTLPSHYSIMTSLHPSAHGVNPDRRLWAGYQHPSEVLDVRGSGRETMLAERLRDLGYFTAAVTDNGWVYPRFGFDQGFVSYVADTYGSLGGTSERVGDWLRDHADMPFFLFVHTYQPHQPYDPPPPYDTMFVDPDHLGYALPGVPVPMGVLTMLKDPVFPVMPADIEAFRALYDGDLRYTDTLVADLVETLEAANLARDTIVVVTSDHGEELFEHGGFDHGDTLYDEVMRVPLIFWGPGRVAAGTEIAGSVALLDILPTIVELAGGVVEPPVQGRSLAGLLGGTGESAPSREVFAEALTKDRGPLYCLWSGRYKYIRSGEDRISEELYDLESDPGETTSLARDRPALTARYGERVERLIRENELIQEGIGQARETLDPEVRERLRSLGYLD